MFKKMILTAACTALLSTTAAHADPAHYNIVQVSAFGEVNSTEWTDGEKINLRITGTLTPAGTSASTSGSTITVDVSQVVNSINGADIVVDNLFSCTVKSVFFLECVTTFTPRFSDAGTIFSPAFTITDNTGTRMFMDSQRVSYVAPPYDDGQHANVEGVLISHPDRKIRKAGEIIRFAFNVSDLTRPIPAGDYVRISTGAADIVRNDGSADSNQDFGFTCPSVGAGVPVGGSFSCSGAYTVTQTDIDAGEIMLAFGAGLSTRDFTLWGGSVMEVFEAAEEETPKPEKPTDPETPTACNRLTPPANGAKFVFRYPTSSVACS